MFNTKANKETLTDKYVGCLIGGAAGDALGYPVEFFDGDDIRARYGKNGITEYKKKNGVAIVSDDTQMTLFTAEGLLESISDKSKPFEFSRSLESIAHAYDAWFITQTESYPQNAFPYAKRLMAFRELYSRRAPGGTCLSALLARTKGIYSSIASPVNNSKGCGGVMRVAPIGLFMPYKAFSIEDCDMLAAEAAAVTHGHELGYISAAGLAHIVRAVAIEGMTVEEATKDMIKTVGKLFSGASEIGVFTDLMSRAAALAKAKCTDSHAIDQLGEGWIGEEALAISVFCAIRYSEDFEGALIASVNHRGDSDSTGAITGNILGASLGASAIPEKFKKDLELFELTKTLAEELLESNVNIAK